MINTQVEEFRQRAGEEIFDLLAMELPPEEAARPTLAKCPHCKRRPELRPIRGSAVKIQVRAGSPNTVDVPKYEIMPCCSARYLKTVEHATRLQKIRAEAAAARAPRPSNSTRVQP